MINRVLNFVGGIPDLLFLRMPSFMIETNPAAYPEYLDQLRFYSSGRFAEPGEPFFSLPQEAPAFEVIESRPDRSGVLEVLRYPSRYQVRNPALREAFARRTASLSSFRISADSGSSPLTAGMPPFSSRLSSGVERASRRLRLR